MIRLLFSIALILSAPALSMAQQSATGASMNETSITGTFDVNLTPNSAADAPFGGLAIAKTFHGPLSGTSVGQMLAERTPVEGSAGYVALERVTATLAGRSGTFVLQHSGTMDRGAQSLSITVVPDSGTDGLSGISGRMQIRIEGGVHHYDFTYRLTQQ
jgi:Protein of unknown function (DUF3224)/HI0933-like protein